MLAKLNENTQNSVPRVPLTSFSAKNVNVDARFDGCEHFRKIMDTKNSQRCKFPGCKRKTKFMCRKCQAYLCIIPVNANEEDCFYLFHHG